MFTHSQPSRNYRHLVTDADRKAGAYCAYVFLGVFGAIGISIVVLGIMHLRTLDHQKKSYVRTTCHVYDYHVQKTKCGQKSTIHDCYNEQFQVTYRVASGETRDSEIVWQQRTRLSVDKQRGRRRTCWYNPAHVQTVIWEFGTSDTSYVIIGLGVFFIFVASGIAVWLQF